MIETAPEPGLYRHFKGGMYQVLYLAQHSEDEQLLVIYRSLGDGKTWARPVCKWVELADAGGRLVPRFERVQLEEITPGLHTATLDLSQPFHEEKDETHGRGFFPMINVLGVNCHLEFLEVEYIDEHGQVSPEGHGIQRTVSEYWRSYHDELDRAFGFNGALESVLLNGRRYIFFIYPRTQ